jgi:lactoylglutathione lyase
LDLHQIWYELKLISQGDIKKMYKMHHIHLKAPDPQETAQWYVDNFDATVKGEAQGLGGSKTIRIDVGGGLINVTSAPLGETLPEGTADYHFGLEHFGFETEDIEASMSLLKAAGVEVLLPITNSATGAKISYIKGPDNVRIELVQPA